MKMQNGIVILNDAAGFIPKGDGVEYRDIKLNKVFVPMRLVIRLYEIAKYEAELNGVNWEKYCDSLFEEVK